jgi:hypothetical protein
VNDRFHIVTLRGCRQDDVPSSGADVSIEIFSSLEGARALEHDIHVQRLPWQARRIPFAQQRQPMLPDGEVVVISC